ncbi:MAG TPA: hypothetical protein PKZ22_11640 [Accumulibacter sp.]|nr:hypothetical protein [Accumulibacter sp.]
MFRAGDQCLLAASPDLAAIHLPLADPEDNAIMLDAVERRGNSGRYRLGSDGGHRHPHRSRTIPRGTRRPASRGRKCCDGLEDQGDAPVADGFTPRTVMEKKSPA